MRKFCTGLLDLNFHVFGKEESTIEDFLKNREEMNDYCFFDKFYPDIDSEAIEVAIKALQEKPVVKLEKLKQDTSDDFFSKFEFLFHDLEHVFYGYNKKEKAFYQLYHGETLSTLVKLEVKTLEELFTKLATEFGHWNLAWKDEEIISMDYHLQNELETELDLVSPFDSYPYFLENENDFNGQVHSSSTAGLYRYDSGLMLNDKPFSFEILVGVTTDKEVNLNWFYEMVYEVNHCKLPIVEGFYITNPITLKSINPHMEAIVFIHPVIWNEISHFELEHKTVGWLMAMPILKKELKILQKKGVEELMAYVQKQKINPFDVYRKPKFSLFG